ncbi:hypothetical protein K493DRAFT_65626 [Basidiobolus meristosporus CBS 931.73]|uniref:RNA polymerase III RPC4-domain-containing protein n=1 Tax=Basidiobolus meristosporus CBS 931.73 TaxID=1314790 RepID=A0A1Y1XWP9_9FUNG|nr:hypothetical protein K493DRAFT_65626 [Basidiobolus meristosporus CBS 931.73]|eukprot:ORX89764.1 hypothetical protein K493DRAFT_65626 [Basidiobolus meristosporus CBS 931.73]
MSEQARSTPVRAAKGTTRGGTQKMRFTPTIPTKRNKKESAPSLLDNAISSNATGNNRGRGRGRGGRGGRGRGRGRGKGPEELVSVASGPFSMGPAMGGSRGAERGGSGQEVMVTGSSSREPAHSNIPSENMFSASDNYDDDANDGEFFTNGDAWTPVMLPYTSEVKKEPRGDDTLMVEHDLTNEENQVKTEVDEEASSMSDSKSLYGCSSSPGLDLISNANENAGDERLFYFQFPSQLPAFEVASDKQESNEMEVDMTLVKQEPADVDAENGEVVVKKEVAEGETEATAAAAPSLEDAGKPEGLMGKLLVYKSGKTQIKIGELIFDISPGSDCGFLQNIVAVDSENKQAFVMGNVHKRFVSTPNIDSLLG